jgi:hypothetical protein
MARYTVSAGTWFVIAFAVIVLLVWSGTGFGQQGNQA